MVLQSNLKYLFNFKFFRIIIKNDSESYSINVISNSIHPVEIVECLPLDNEENLLEKNIPLHFFQTEIAPSISWVKNEGRFIGLVF